MSFKEAKLQVTSKQVRAHYNPDLPVIFMIIIILVLPPVAFQSNCALTMPGTADGYAISHCQVLGRAGGVNHGADQWMLHGMHDATVTRVCFIEYPHFDMFTLDRPTGVRNWLSAFQVVQGFSASARRCSSALMLRCTLASRGLSRSLHNSMRSSFAVVLMGSVHLMKHLRDFRRDTTRRCPLSGCFSSVVCSVRSVRLRFRRVRADCWCLLASYSL